MNGESKGARVASGDLKMRCILKRLTEPTGESSALWHTTLLAKSIPNKTVRMGGAGNGSRKDQGLHMKVDTKRRTVRVLRLVSSFIQTVLSASEFHRIMPYGSWAVPPVGNCTLP